MEKSSGLANNIADNIANNIFEEYIRTRDEYYANMSEMLIKGEYRKASELLWGAIAQSIKALASLSSINIRIHGDFFKYVKEVAKEKQDEEYKELFHTLNALHKNFYDLEFPPEDFSLYQRKADEFISKNEGFIRDKLAELKESD